MKKTRTFTKKALSLFLSLLMLVTTVPLVALPASAADSGTVTNKNYLTINTNSRETQYDNYNVGAYAYSDGGAGNTGIATLRFDVSSIPSNANVKLTLGFKKANTSNGNAEVAVLFATQNGDAPVDDSTTRYADFNNLVLGTDYTGVNVFENVVEYYDAIEATRFKLSEVNKRVNDTEFDVKEIDVTNVFRDCKAAGVNTIRVIIAHTSACSGSEASGWSDVIVDKIATMAWEETESVQVTLDVNKYTTLVDSGRQDNAGYNDRVCIYNEGNAQATSLGSLQFDFSTVPADATNIKLKFRVKKLESGAPSNKLTFYAARQNVDKPVPVTHSNGGYWTQDGTLHDSIFGTSFSTGSETASTNMRTYFDAVELGYYTITNWGTDWQDIELDITNKISDFKSRGIKTLNILIMHKNSDTTTGAPWSDCIIQPSACSIEYTSESGSPYIYGMDGISNEGGSIKVGTGEDYNYLKVTYPKHIYMDVTETLQGLG